MLKKKKGRKETFVTPYRRRRMHITREMELYILQVRKLHLNVLIP
jgi:hypothetical protein